MGGSNSDDFFAFALDGASSPSPAPKAPTPGPAPTAGPAAAFTAPPFVPPATPGPAPRAPASLAPELSLDDDAPFQAPSRTMMALMKARESPRATAAILVTFVVLGVVVYLLATRGDEGATAKRFEAASSSGGARAIATPGGPVPVPGRATIAAAVEVVRDPDAPAEQRKVACTLAAGDEVVVTAAEDANGATRARVQGAAAGCEGWLAASALAPSTTTP
ncbi:MAG: hypothetical protein IT383_23190 [Deltaproteobacteria bacterium]|nr:hypothetical protein [Deltaproteobacteria bacterium]